MHELTLTKRNKLTGHLPWEVLRNLGLISIGCLVFIAGMNSVLIPHGFLTGGITGIAMLTHYLNNNLSVGLMYLLLNIPLALLGFRSISGRFIAYTIYGMIFFAAAAEFLQLPPVEISDPILAALFGGVICGIGCGLIFRSRGSAGGLDILFIYLNKRFGLRVGGIAFAANALVLLAGAYLHDIQLMLYSLVYMYTSARVTDAIITGFNQRKAVLVISDQAQAIAGEIFSRINRGVTFLKGEGAYTGQSKQVILSVTTLTELPRMKELILDIDPNAFLIVNDTLEVIGKRHGSRRAY